MTQLSMLTALPFLFTDKHILKELPAVTTPINLSTNLSLIHSDQTFLYTTPLKAYWWRPLMYVLMKVTNNMGVAKSRGYFSALSYVNSHWPSTQLTDAFLSWRLWSHTSVSFSYLAGCSFCPLHGTYLPYLKYKRRSVSRIRSWLLFHFCLFFILR